MEGRGYRAPLTYLTKQGWGPYGEARAIFTGSGQPLSYVISPVLFYAMNCGRPIVDREKHIGEAALVPNLYCRVPETWNRRSGTMFAYLFFCIFGACYHMADGQ